MASELGLAMNEFEAFRRAVEIYRDGGWRSTRPNSPTLLAGRHHRTIRQICTLISNSRAELPDETIADLRQCLDLCYPALAEALERDRTYGSGAQCLLKLMDDNLTSCPAIELQWPTASEETAIS